MSENEDFHQFPLQGVSASRRETKSKPMIISSPGEFNDPKEDGKTTHTCIGKHYHKLSYPPFVLLKELICFS